MGLPPTEWMNVSISSTSLRRPVLRGAGIAGSPWSPLVAFINLVVAFIVQSQVVNRKLQGVLQAHAGEPVFAQLRDQPDSKGEWKETLEDALRRSKVTCPRRLKSQSDLMAYMIEQSQNVSQSIPSAPFNMTSYG